MAKINCISLQLLTIFVDMEGAFTEELAAIAVNSETLEIRDVFHEFAKSQRVDCWSRKHVHGLNRMWLDRHAKYDNETQLILAFREWLQGKNVLAFFANDPAKERQVFGKAFDVSDLKMPMWAQRELRSSHQMALIFKRALIPVLNKRCCFNAHSSFSHVPTYRNTTSDFAKRRWGVHCALYDCYEDYLYFVEERALRL